MARDFAKSFYQSRNWKQCRDAYVSSVDYLCERCLAEGKHSRGFIVHHKVHLNESNINDVNVTLNWDSLEFLCMDHHNREHFGSYDSTVLGVSFDELGNLIER